MTLIITPPPATTIEPVTEFLHGVKVTDPYRWLEDQDSPRTRNWLDEQIAYSRAYLHAISGRERIRKRVEELLAVETVSEPWKVGHRYFFLKREPYQQQPVIMMREGDAGEDIRLVDPMEKDASGKLAVGIVSISPDASLLAYSVRDSGEDWSAVEFIDVHKREQLSDQLAPGLCRGLVFAGNNSGFFYSHEPKGSTRSSRRAILWHAFGTQGEEDPEVFFAGDDPTLRLVLLSSPSARCLGYYKLFATDPKRIDFSVQDLTTGTPPQLIVSHITGVFVPLLLDDDLLVLTDLRAPNCRIVRIDLNHPDSENWSDIVPESTARIRGMAVAGNRIFVSSTRDLSTRIDVFDLAGKELGTMPWPSKGTTHMFPCRSNSDSIFFRFTSFIHPPSIIRHNITTALQETWIPSQVRFDTSSFEIGTIQYPSKDGTAIPMFLVRSKDRRVDGPLPTFLTGYGGFGNTVTPQFTAYATYLIERGCLFAVANLRGGSEFGESWHLAAKRQRRQTAIDDFIAAAEWLFAERYSTLGKLAIGGGSNAGLLVAAAITQRPDLFRAAVCLGPLLDMFRYHLFDFANAWIDEFGSAEIETDFHALRGYSPYQGVKDGLAYPAVMLISGDADTRCNPMHARKMTARLQAATKSSHPVLLDYRPAWGHTPVQPLTQRIDALTDRLAFLCHELDLN